MGFGDFSNRPGETDMILPNANNGGVEVYDISNNDVGATRSSSGASSIGVYFPHSLGIFYQALTHLSAWTCAGWSGRTSGGLDRERV
jgi:hypothetical protein